jgi:hypothetical protein
LGINHSNEVTQVLFETQASIFATNDLNEENDLYLATLGVLENHISLISKQLDNAAASIIENQALLQDDYIYFVSDSSNLVGADNNLSQDIFSKNITSGQIQRLTAELDVQLTSLSNVEYNLLGVDARGKKLMFSSNLDNPDVTDGSLNQVYILDLNSRQIELISATADGSPGNDASVVGAIDSFATNFAIQTESTNLVDKPGTTLITQNKTFTKIFDMNGKGVTGIEFNIYKDNTLLEESVFAEDGDLLITDIVDFDSIVINTPEAYEPGINIVDAISVLRSIVGLTNLSESSLIAADTNNDNNVNIVDAIEILRHIVGLKTINTYDLVDEDGAQITRLDIAEDQVQSWTLVANGDVDHSGYFAEDFTIQATDIL